MLSRGTMTNDDHEDQEEKPDGAGVDCNAEQETDSRAAEGDRGKGGKSSLGFVYFIETEDGQYVKIGFSRRPSVRMSELAPLRPGKFALRLIGTVQSTQHVEAWFHMAFAQDRDNGEWFRSTPRLRAFMDALQLIPPIEQVRQQSSKRRRKVARPMTLI